jgi:hypothetical protein
VEPKNEIFVRFSNSSGSFPTFAATRRASLRLSAQAYIGISQRHEKAVKEKPALR